MLRVPVYLNGRGGDRILVKAEVVKVNQRTLHVRLADGAVIERRIARDVPERFRELFR